MQNDEPTSEPWDYTTTRGFTPSTYPTYPLQNEEAVHALTFRGGSTRVMRDELGGASDYYGMHHRSREINIIRSVLNLADFQRKKDSSSKENAILKIARAISDEWKRHVDRMTEQALSRVATNTVNQNRTAYFPLPYGSFTKYISCVTVGCIGEIETGGVIKLFFRSEAGTGRRYVTAYLCRSGEKMHAYRSGKESYTPTNDQMTQDAFHARTILVNADVLLRYTVCNRRSKAVDLGEADQETTRFATAIAEEVVTMTNLLSELYLFTSPRWDLFSSSVPVEYTRPSTLYNASLFYVPSALGLPQREDWIGLEERREWFDFLSCVKGRAEEDYKQIIREINCRSLPSVGTLKNIFIEEQRTDNRSAPSLLSTVVMVENNAFDYNAFNQKWKGGMTYPFQTLDNGGWRQGPFHMASKQINLNRSWFNTLVIMNGDVVSVPIFQLMNKTRLTELEGDKVIEPALIYDQTVAASDDIEYWVNGSPIFEYWINGSLKRSAKVVSQQQSHAVERETYRPVRLCMIDDFWGKEVEVSWAGLISFDYSQDRYRGVFAQLNYMAMKTRLIMMVQSWERWTSFESFFIFLSKMMREEEGGAELKQQRTGAAYFFSEKGKEMRKEWYTKHVLHNPVDEKKWISKRKRRYNGENAELVKKQKSSPTIPGTGCIPLVEIRVRKGVDNFQEATRKFLKTAPNVDYFEDE